MENRIRIDTLKKYTTNTSKPNRISTLEKLRKKRLKTSPKIKKKSISMKDSKI